MRKFVKENGPGALRSTRNGFLVASVLLLGAMAWQYLAQGEWNFAVSTSFFLSQAAYWGSLIYYRWREPDGE